MTVSLAATRDISGFIRANLINARYGMGVASSEEFPDDVENAEVSEKMRLLRRPPDEDLVLTVEDHYHVIRPLDGMPELFMHVVLDRRSTDLAAARACMAQIARSVSSEFAA